MSRTINSRANSGRTGGLDEASITAAGRAAGLTDCGVAGCEPSERGAFLDRWLAEGAHASMAWMARTAEVRKELTTKWEWARTALVGVMSYLTEPVDRRELPGIARHISRYARGEDYHDLLRERLARWVETLAAQQGAPFRHALLVDTSAVLERELAVRAGLGWIGKNTCLIGPRGDSWRFIGVVLTDLDPAALIPAPAPSLAERCGTCTACLDACPTGALPEPFFLDSRRCISYLTIEHRGAVPEPLRRKMGEWLFGCDICQAVCPWNRKVSPVSDARLSVDPRYTETSLAQLAALDEEQFRAAFRKTPLARPKRQGLVRNALIAGANIADPELLKQAAELLDDDDPVIAETARWASNRGGEE